MNKWSSAINQCAPRTTYRPRHGQHDDALARQARAAQPAWHHADTQTVVTHRFALERDLTVFPYTPRTSTIFGRVLEVVYGR